MQVLFDNFGLILDGFVKTLWLLLFSGLIAAVLGTVLVVPARLARRADAAGRDVVHQRLPQHPTAADPAASCWHGAPDLGFTDGVTDYFNFFFVSATIGLGLYAAAFVCEALRSGINSIPMGQAEAARAIGMTFGQSMTSIILPQAFRAVIPPLTSTYIAWPRTPASRSRSASPRPRFVMKKLNNEHACERWPIFFGFAFGYILIVAAIAGIGCAARAEGCGSR